MSSQSVAGNATGSSSIRNSHLAGPGSTGQRIRRRLTEYSALVEKHSRWIGFVLLGFYAIVALGEAADKYLWYDELITMKTGAFPRWQDVYAFYYHGLDTTSATPSLLVHFALKLHASPEISARLPFICAFMLLLVCMYTFMHRRYPAVYGFAVCAMTVMTTFSLQAVEARGYALSYFGAGLAMVGWQVASKGERYRIGGLLGLWFGLAWAVNSHSFAVFVIPPFVLAQAIRDYRRRYPDWPVWFAICLSVLGIIPVLHGQRIANRFYGKTFWSVPDRYQVIISYEDLLLSAGVIFLGIIFCFLALVSLKRDRWKLQEGDALRSSGFRPEEWTLLCGVALIPFFAFPAAYLFLHVYRPVYAWSCSIGLLLLLCAILAEAALRSRIAGLVLFGSLLFGVAQVRHVAFRDGVHVIARPNGVHARLQVEFVAQPWVALLNSRDLPIVAGDGETYLEILFYGTPDLIERTSYLSDLRELKRYPGAETTQLNFLLFGTPLKLPTVDVSSYFRAHNDFLLVYRTGWTGMWIPQFLATRQKVNEVSLDFIGPLINKSTDYAAVFDVHTIPAAAEISPDK